MSLNMVKSNEVKTTTSLDFDFSSKFRINFRFAEYNNQILLLRNLKKLKLSNYRPFSSKFVLLGNNDLPPSIESLIISNCNSIGIIPFEDLPLLKNFELHNQVRLMKINLCLAKSDLVSIIITNCKNLETIILSGMRLLTTLDIQFCPKLKFLDFNELVNKSGLVIFSDEIIDSLDFRSYCDCE